MLFAHIILFLCTKLKIKKLLFIAFLTPSVMYAMTGFEEIYEMKSRSYINEMYKDFNSIKYKDYDSLNELHYKTDAVYYYYFKYFDEYSEYLTNSYGNLGIYEFESILLKDNIISN